MKKLISLLLVVLLLSSMSVSAFAADTQMGVGDEATDIEETNATEGSANTELWLQVAANGQIDVTVPLVLVFQTNIDGGKADTATNYKISNNNNANIIVTRVATATVSDKMGIVAYATSDGDLKKLDDSYKVQLTALNSDETAVTVKDTTNGTSVFDLSVDSYSNSADNGGLFTLDRLDNEDDRTVATETIIKAEMMTSPLSFITPKDANGDIDDAKGLHLLTVTYTVAIDTSTVYETAPMTDAGTITWESGTDNVA